MEDHQQEHGEHRSRYVYQVGTFHFDFDLKDRRKANLCFIVPVHCKIEERPICVL